MAFYAYLNLVTLFLEQGWRYVISPINDLAGLGLKLPIDLD